MQQVYYLVFHDPFISALIVVSLGKVKLMSIDILWRKCSQLVGQIDFELLYAYFV